MKGLLWEGRKRNVGSGSGSGRRKEMMIAVFFNFEAIVDVRSETRIITLIEFLIQWKTPACESLRSTIVFA